MARSVGFVVGLLPLTGFCQVRDHTRAEAVDKQGKLLHSYPELNKFSEPHIDSPPLSVRVVDRHWIVVRMKYTGLAR